MLPIPLYRYIDECILIFALYYCGATFYGVFKLCKFSSKTLNNNRYDGK